MSVAHDPYAMRVGADGTVRLLLAGGGSLDVATSPRLDVARGRGPRRAFLSPATGRRGPLLAIVEGVPGAVAELFYERARDELESTPAAPGSSLGRAVRTGCAAVRGAARLRPDLDAFGFTAVLVESVPQPVAFVAQLPPCQMYVIDGASVRAVPEVLTGQAGGRTRRVAERRWEVEIESVRVPLSHDSRIVLVDASVPELLGGSVRVADLGRRGVALASARLERVAGAHEGVVVRFAHPPGILAGLALASRAMGLFRRLSGDADLLAWFRGVGVRAQARSQPGPEATTGDPALVAALLELEATGRVPTSLPGTAIGRPLEIGLRTGGLPSRPSPRSVRGGPGLGRALEAPGASIGVRRRATAPGAPVRQSEMADVPWLAPVRGSLVPATLTGTPLASARFPRATDPRSWIERLIDPAAFLPGGRRPTRRGRSTLVAMVVGVGVLGLAWLVSPSLVGGLFASVASTLRLDPDTGIGARIGVTPSTPTTVPATPTVPVLAGRTVAHAKGRFASLAAPAHLPNDRTPMADAIMRVLDDSGDVLTIPIASPEPEREAVPPRATAIPDARAFVARGLFADGGALAQRDDGTILLDPGGGLVLLPARRQPARAIKVKSLAQWAVPVGAVVYGASLYVFDAGHVGTGPRPSGQVWRHPQTTGGNYESDAVPWLVAGQQVDLTLASDVATDGTFWVSRRDGSIVRLAGGKAEELDIKGDARPTRLGAIYTDQGTQSIYTVDEGSRRLLRIAKDGVIQGVREAVLAPGEAARGLWVDEGAGIAVVVTTGRVAIVPLP